jgi:hypothetical protein
MSNIVGAPEGQADQASAVRVANAVQDQMAAQPNLRLTDAANRVKLDLAQQANRVLAQIKPLIDADDYRDIRSDINDGARRQNNTVSQGTFDLINSLDVPAEQKAALAEYTRDLNTASTQSFIKNTTGPLQKIGGVVGNVGSLIGGVASGNPLEMGAALLGHGLAGKIGAGLGAMGDRFLGTNTPEVMLRAMAARRALQAAGQDPNAIQPTPMPGAPEVPPPPPAAGPAPNPVAVMMAAKRAAAANPPPPAVNPVTGNPPDAVPVNTPIKFTPNTPADVRMAMAQDDGLPPAPAALQAVQQGQAMAAAAQPPAPPTASPAPAWLRYLQNGNAGITREAALAAAQRAEAAGQLPTGQAALLGTHQGGIDPQLAQAIRAQIGNGHAGPGDQPAIRSPLRYKLAADNYHQQVIAKAAQLRAQGQTAAAEALVDIAVNKHSKADKRAARAALPPEVAAQIPDFVVNHGGN